MHNTEPNSQRPYQQTHHSFQPLRTTMRCTSLHNIKQMHTKLYATHDTHNSILTDDVNLYSILVLSSNNKRYYIWKEHLNKQSNHKWWRVFVLGWDNWCFMCFFFLDASKISFMCYNLLLLYGYSFPRERFGKYLY